MQTNEILNLLKSKNVQDFVDEHINNNTSELALKFSGKVNFNLSNVLNYLKLLQKARNKLPEHYKKRCLLTDKSYEQSTSERVALYKAPLLKCVKLLNLTGGLGVDDWALAKECNEVTSIDIDGELNEIVNENLTRLGTDNVTRVTADAYKYIKDADTPYDIIYLDPDRREESQRVYSLKDSEPNYHLLKDDLFKLTSLVVIKASPMLDIKELEREVEALAKVLVIAEDNEVKELLLFVNHGHKGPLELCAVNLGKSIEEFNSTNITAEPNYLTEGEYFYEPNKAIIKAGLSKQYAVKNSLALISNRSTYMLSNKLINDYQGRSFKVQSIHDYKSKSLKKLLKNMGINQANIGKRNFRESVEELYKLSGIKDGGNTYLFFTTTLNGDAKMYIIVKA